MATITEFTLGNLFTVGCNAFTAFENLKDILEWCGAHATSYRFAFNVDINCLTAPNECKTDGPLLVLVDNEALLFKLTWSNYISKEEHFQVV